MGAAPRSRPRPGGGRLEPLTTRRVAISGAGGQLGSELVRTFEAAGDEVLALARPEFDITAPADIARLAAWHPDIVVNSAAWTDVDGCAADPERAMRLNGQAAGELARSTAGAGALIVQISTNEVFDGELDRAYTEDDPPHPINPYGASKLAGELAVAAENQRHMVVRTAWLYGPRERNFPGKIRAAAARMAAEGRPLRVVADEWGNPTDVRGLAPAIRRLALMGVAAEAPFGTYHLAGEPAVSRLGWAQAILAGSGTTIEPVSLADFERASRVPPRAVLDSSRARHLGLEVGDWRSSPPGSSGDGG